MFGLLASVSQAQTFEWIKKINTAGNTSTVAIAADKQGNIYSVGIFTGTVAFGTDTLRSLGYAGQYDVFILKADSAGNKVWAKRAGGIYDDSAVDIAADSAGNVYFTGWYRNAATFGNLTAPMASHSDANPYVVKYDTNGNAVWLKVGTGNNDGFGRGVEVDAAGNVLMAADVSGTTTFDGVVFQTFQVRFDVVLIKYSPAGTLLWAKTGGNQNNANDIVRCTAVDKQGNVFISGQFATTFSIDNVTITGSSYDFDIYLAKFNAAGALQWLKLIRSTGYEIPFDLAVDNLGNPHLAGYDFGATFGATTLTGSGAFLAKFDPAGNAIWAKRFNQQTDANYSADNASVSIDASGNIYYLSEVYGTKTFGNFTINATSNNLSIFLAGFNSAGTIEWVELAKTNYRPQSARQHDIPSRLIPANRGRLLFSGSVADTTTFGNIQVVAGGKSHVFVAKVALPLRVNGGSGAPATVCSGSTLNISYSADTSFQAGNIFTAQLSDASGSFDSPVAIGTVNATTSGTIPVLIPAATPTGLGYRIRVVASAPAITSAGVYPQPIINSGTAAISAAGNTTFCQGGSVALQTIAVPGGTYAWHLNGTTISGAGSATYVASQAGNYTVAMTSSCGTATSAGNSVTVNPVPATPAIQLIAPDTLMASVVAGSYEWKHNGTTLPTTTQKLKAAAPGLYSVKAIGAGSCPSGVSADFNYVVSGWKEEGTGIFTLFPNPTTGKVDLLLNNPGEAQVTIFNALGQLILTKTLGVNGSKVPAAFDLSKAARGIYLVKVKTGNQVITRKLVLEK